MAWKPTVVTTCYGMNDGKYRPYEDFIGEAYRKGMETIVKFLKSKNIRTIVGAPGVVDSESWQRNNPDADKFYNANLAKLAKIVKEIAKTNELSFSDIHGQMMKFMLSAKKQYGEKYVVGGRDGIHPEKNGHFLMAYSFLSSLDLPEKIAEINVDFKNEKIDMSHGHILQKSHFGALEAKLNIESSKYPFCFQSDNRLNNENNLLGVLPFIDFQEKFNNFELKVRNIPTKTASIRWGTKTKTFNKKELAKGINLANEFIENPFQSSFLNISNLIYHKQSFETSFVKRSFSGLRAIQQDFKGDKEATAFTQNIVSKYMLKHQGHVEKVKQAIQPLKHELFISLNP